MRTSRRRISRIRRRSAARRRCCGHRGTRPAWTWRSPFAGACLKAGLDPLIMLIERSEGTGGRHALVGVWVQEPPEDVQDELDAGTGVWEELPGWLPGLVRRTADDAGRPLVVLDPVGVSVALPSSPARGVHVDFGQAVANGADRLSETGWSWRAGVDLARAWRERETYQPAARPTVSPLRAPYLDPGSVRGPLQLLRADYRIVPFQPRDELTVLRHWCGQAASQPAAGAGGHRRGRRVGQDPPGAGTGPAAPGPGLVCGPAAAQRRGLVLVPVGGMARQRRLPHPGHRRLRRRPRGGHQGLAARPGRPGPGPPWWCSPPAPSKANGSPKSRASCSATGRSSPSAGSTLPPEHPDSMAIFRRAVAAFAAGAPPAAARSCTGADAAIAAPERWTTLDYVLLGWLVARTAAVTLPPPARSCTTPSWSTRNATGRTSTAI